MPEDRLYNQSTDVEIALVRALAVGAGSEWFPDAADSSDSTGALHMPAERCGKRVIQERSAARSRWQGAWR